MPDYRDQVSAALGATAFQSPTRFTWFGRPSPRLPRDLEVLLSPSAAERYLLATLQNELYRHWYRHGSARPEREWDGSDVANVRPTPFVDLLRAANLGRGYWSHGWTLLDDASSDVLIEKRGLRLLASTNDCQGVNGQHGTDVDVRFAKELLSVSPGYYMALGDSELPESEPDQIVRLYFNLRPSGAPGVVKVATTILNATDVAFTLKVLSDPLQYTRCDAAVLYVQNTAYDDIADQLGKVYRESEPHLRQSTPAFTKRLADGLGLAEDPGDGDSFGMHRSERLAGAMIETAARDGAPTSRRLAAVEKHLLEKGIDLDAPYLNPGSTDSYGSAWTRRSRIAAPKAPRAASRKRVTESPLEVAAGIGRQLLEDAIWFGGACNWLGYTYDGTQPRKAAHAPSADYRALGGDLYSGTAGLALFLTDLARATGDRAVRAAAVGAMRHAFSHSAELDPSMRLGLYTGWPGIAWAGARVAEAAEAEEFLHRGGRLMSDLARQGTRGVAEWDLLAGAAGAIVASVSLADALSQPTLVDFASELAAALLARAEVRAEGISWKSSDATRGRNLTGFAHGTAGIAYALAELYRYTRDVEFRVGAERALSYESHWYDEDARNWPDFRGVSRRRMRSGYRFACSTYWCHGAPGIALSRLHAHEVLGSPDYRAQAITALTTTREVIEEWLRSGDGNFSLCHGLAGDAEIVAHGSHVLKAAWPEGQPLARRVAEDGVDRYWRAGKEWPCGTAGETPDLMLGLAGIGHFYLRVDHPEYATSLLVGHPRTDGSATGSHTAG